MLFTLLFTMLFTLLNFFILFKLIKSLIVLVSSKLWYASFPWKNYVLSAKFYVLKFLKTNYLNLVPAPIFKYRRLISFTKKQCLPAY